MEDSAMTTRGSQRTHTRRLFVAGAAVAAVLATALVAKADEESDLVRAIEDDLGYIKGYLDGIAGDSSDGDLGYAIDYVGRVREKAEKLRSVGATSDNARTMAEKTYDLKDSNDTHGEAVVNETKAVETCERRISAEC